MTSTHSLNDASPSQDPAPLLDDPRIIHRERFVGLDLGHVRDRTAIAVLELATIAVRPTFITYEWIKGQWHP